MIIYLLYKIIVFYKKYCYKFIGQNILCNQYLYNNNDMTFARPARVVKYFYKIIL